jgi:hypothetical protein
MNASRGISCAAAIALLGVLAGCSHMPRPHLAWPWGHKAAPAPQEVHELTIAPAAEGGSTAFPQYWKRNTLLVDLQTGGGTGGIVLKPVPGTAWPVRIAFRVMPGQFGALEVRGDARLRLPIAAQGTQPIDLELSPDIYTLRTSQLTVTWGPAAAPPES